MTHSYIISRDNEPVCDECIVPLTVKHLLVECPSLVEYRSQFLSYGRDLNGIFRLDKILGPEGDFNENGLFGFLINISILEKL